MRRELKLKRNFS